MAHPSGHAAPNRRSLARQNRALRAARRGRGAKMAARLAVVAAAAAGIAGFSAAHKTVTITVDGASREVTTFAGSVEGVLAQEHIAYTERDLVAPALEAPVPRSGQIVIRTARQMDLVIDGQPRTVWTTAATVDEVLADLGVRSDEAQLSVSRRAAIERLVGAVDVSTPKALSVTVDGVVMDTYSNAPSVRQVLVELGVILGEHDQVSPGLDEIPEPGQQIVIERAITASGTEVVAIPFETVEKEDPTLAKGAKKIETPGVAGQRVITYRTKTAGGVEVSREKVLEAVTAQPVTQVVLIGTKTAPVAPEVNIDVDPGSAQGIAKQMMLDSYGWGDDQFACLVSLWNRESGWRVNAANRSSGAYGIPQALPGSKMASAGSDWQTNPATQIKWGLGYISGRYSTPCGAWGAFQSKGWY
ncbi:MAG: ubiquitin-like domain-containing protein [Bifidobacteriaceae bacterium]|nr:ubiquitin-like domain-containing protein [Bifidobacteriaceae bacterium]